MLFRNSNLACFMICSRTSPRCPARKARCNGVWLLASHEFGSATPNLIKENLNNIPVSPLQRIMQGWPVTVIPGIHLRAILEENPNNSEFITKATATRYSHRGPLAELNIPLLNAHPSCNSVQLLRSRAFISVPHSMRTGTISR